MDAATAPDPLERADRLRDELRDSSPCFTCGSPAPAIIEGRFCSDCPDVAAFRAAAAVRAAKEKV